ncbi:MAG: hypothetical protein BGO30_09200 [Bacteroidetes bacterium 41-46]|nr:MAG: hypothetical protein BGO30_09200 [Bacteroidetes bacterium 41-46]
MAKVSFILINKKREISAVRAQIVHNRIKYVFNPKVSVEVQYFSKGRVKASAEAGAINNKLEAVEAAMKNAIVYYNKSFTTPTQEQFERIVEKFLGGDNAIQISRKEQNLIEYIERYISECGLSAETKKGYNTTLNKLREFSQGREITFDEVTLLFEKRFKKWLIKQDYSKNYIWSIIKNLKKFMKDAERIDKLHSNRDYEEFEMQSETADTIYLTMPELYKLLNLEFTDEMISQEYKETRPANIERIRKSLIKANYKFLIGAVCAMRVSDYSRILNVDLGLGIITITPKKGSSLRKPEPIKLPIHPIMREIINRGFRIDTEVPAFMINRQIKIICKLAKINSPITCRITKGGELQETVKEKWKWITSHTARRSGATNMYRSGVPLRLIRACTGHKTDEMVLKYIKANIEDNLDELMKCRYYSDLEIKF